MLMMAKHQQLINNHIFRLVACHAVLELLRASTEVQYILISNKPCQDHAREERQTGGGPVTIRLHCLDAHNDFAMHLQICILSRCRCAPWGGPDGKNPLLCPLYGVDVAQVLPLCVMLPRHTTAIIAPVVVSLGRRCRQRPLVPFMFSLVST